ncbi:MAG: amidohydrolase family protein [Rhodothalassiaceae bacterium]
MRKASGFLAAAAMLLAPHAMAETYIHAGRLLDVDSGRLESDQAILVDDEGRIRAVGPASALAPPADATVIDLAAYTVLPGLIDAHVHLLADAETHGYRALSLSLPRRTIIGVRNAKRTLEAGFTTVRNVGADGYADVALRDAIAADEVPGPRLLVSGPPIGITGGHCSDENLLPFEYHRIGEGVADGPWAARAKVRQNVKYGVDLIKTCATGGVLSKGTEVGAPQYTLEELTALVDEAHMHGRKVAVHAHGATGIRNAIRAGADSIEHASFIDDAGIRLAKKHHTVLVMDIYNTEYILGAGEAAGILPESLDKERRTGSVQRANFSKAHAAGVTIAFGTDAGVYPHGHNARQFSRMVRFGMTPLEAIRAATTVAADLLGVADFTGRIRPGLSADIIAVEGDPLAHVELLEEVRFVMKEGRVYKAP